MTEKAKHNFTDDEWFIIDALNYVNAEKTNFIGIMSMLSIGEEQSTAQKAKMAKYLKAKGKYITEQDILKKTHQITRKREQYFRPEIYVKYIGKTTEQLTQDYVYRVKAVYGCEESFLLYCDDNTSQEVPAELVEWQDVTKIEYIGCEEDDGTISVTDGFELNKTYNVEPFYMGQYKCDNGLSCWFYEVYPIDFQKTPICEPSSFKNIDEALSFLRGAIEFGDLTNLPHHLHNECEFISQTSGKKFNTKAAIIKHLREVAQKQLDCDVFCDCDFGTLEEVPDNSKYTAGTRCIVNFEKNGCSVFLITLNEKQNYITSIHIFDKQYLQDNNYKIRADYQKEESKTE